MKKFFFLTTLTLGLSLALSAQSFVDSFSDFIGDGKDEICYFSGQLATIGTATGAFAICMETGGATCPVALTLMECYANPACNGTVARITEAGCHFLITKVEDTLYVFGKGDRNRLSELKEVYDNLNTVSGMSWLMNYLQ